MNKYSKYCKVGPGGMNCSCCFPSPGSKDRKYHFRAAKRKEKIEAFKIENDNYTKMGADKAP
jgi:hypothetical protein